MVIHAYSYTLIRHNEWLCNDIRSHGEFFLPLWCLDVYGKSSHLPGKKCVCELLYTCDRSHTHAHFYRKMQNFVGGLVYNYRDGEKWQWKNIMTNFVARTRVRRNGFHCLCSLTGYAILGNIVDLDDHLSGHLSLSLFLSLVIIIIVIIIIIIIL